MRVTTFGWWGSGRRGLRAAKAPRGEGLWVEGALGGGGSVRHGTPGGRGSGRRGAVGGGGSRWWGIREARLREAGLLADRALGGGEGCRWRGLRVTRALGGGAPGGGAFERRGVRAAGGGGSGRRGALNDEAPSIGGLQAAGLRAVGGGGALGGGGFEGGCSSGGASGGYLAKAKANFFPYSIDFPQGAATCRFFNGKTFADALFEKKDEEKKGSPSGGKSEILESFDTPNTLIPSFEYK
ncbi:hypothetical protein GUJ93_ZPchr0010g8985 [Zizania palustris]|uniref:Uncharacterized protein n=1 Tax=Zizania palustris TaxID=103762 RepID=A0A8J5TGX9_ZIZPA|nr:hypothetical protein GUJ93_ZPchr0010g8985 [Zizania palustris]